MLSGDCRRCGAQYPGRQSGDLLRTQLKPSTETQAISRAYRMGQTRSVLVHRLLTEDTVDEAITALLRQKQALFDEYADRSAAGDAQTRTEQEWITRTVAEEQARLGLVPTPESPSPSN